jgi:hypothetical protein
MTFLCRFKGRIAQTLSRKAGEEQDKLAFRQFIVSLLSVFSHGMAVWDLDFQDLCSTFDL